MVSIHCVHVLVRRNRQKRCDSSVVRLLRKVFTFSLIDSSVFILKILCFNYLFRTWREGAKRSYPKDGMAHPWLCATPLFWRGLVRHLSVGRKLRPIGKCFSLWCRWYTGNSALRGQPMHVCSACLPLPTSLSQCPLGRIWAKSAYEWLPFQG